MNYPAKAVFLDRDGVINRPIIRDRKPYSPDSLEEFEILDGVKEALELLKRTGYLVIVVTNQPNIARGKLALTTLDAMHNYLRSNLSIDDIFICMHDDADECACRKPKPGLILSAAQKYSIDLSSSFMIGDRWKDIEAGRVAGCRNIFINWGYQEPQPNLGVDQIFGSLADAARWIGGQTDRRIMGQS